MTFNDNARVGASTTRRRGRGGAIAVGGGVAGIGAIAILLLNLFTGQDFSGLLGDGELPQAGGETEIANCETGADANARIDCRMEIGAVAIDQFWAENVEGYRAPQLIIVDGSTPTQCGTASNQTGPFYCPPEETVYIDPTFFDLMQQRLGASAQSLAQLYVLAHEYGHHVQNITGIMQNNPDDGTGPESTGVRLELQADCFAGAWVREMTESVDASGIPFLKPPTDGELRDALDAAKTVGDDTIQQQSGGSVHPEAWTHGSSEQRQRWFSTGYRDGVAACDTFAVAGDQL